MIKNIEGLLNHVYQEIRFQTDIAVIGMSGGADSTLVTILCKNALGSDNVFGVHMPYDNLDYQTFNSKSKSIATRLNVWNKTINIAPTVDSLIAQFNNVSKLNNGNIRARIRMTTLYSISASLEEKLNKRTRVIGTGNLSEDVIGFFTKYGDQGVDFLPIGSLVKSEVYQLLNYFAEMGTIDKNMIDEIPSAGLWHGQTDEKELGFSYNEMEEAVLTIRDKNKWKDNDVGRFVRKRYNDNFHKLNLPPIIPLWKWRSK